MDRTGHGRVNAGIRAFADRHMCEAHIVAYMRALDVAVYDSWPGFIHGLASAQAGICTLPALQGPNWSRLARLRATHGTLPLILLTDYTRDNARSLARLAVDDVLFLDNLTGEALTAAISTAGRRSALHQAATVLRENPFALDSEIAETLARACCAPRLIRTVDDLARVMGYSRSTLDRRWRSSTRGKSVPHRFVEWLLLMHALRLRTSDGDSWAGIANALNVQEQTIRHSARRLFDVTPCQLERLTDVRLLGGLWRCFDQRGENAAGATESTEVPHFRNGSPLHRDPTILTPH